MTGPLCGAADAVKSISVVIEWENAVFADDARSIEMLHRLSAQLTELSENVAIDTEVIIVFDTANFGADDIAALCDLIRAEAPARTVVIPLGVPGTGYFGAKNAGAKASTGDLIIFLDSDVVPEPTWLRSLYRSFEDPAVDVAGGATYVVPEGLYSSAVSLFWFFPLRETTEGLVPTVILYGNNIAFRREVFLENPFPDVPQFRGQCGLLMRRLQAEGHGVYLQRSARCSHPPQNGLRHFLRRAICEGHDNFVMASRGQSAERKPPLHMSYWTMRNWLPTAYRKIFADRRRAGLTVPGAALAVALASCYCGFVIAGELLTRVSPTFVRQHFAL